MSDREQLEARLTETKLLLRQMALSSLLMLFAGVAFVDGIVVVVPIAVGIVGVASWLYWRAKRELAALDKPPTARLLK